MFECSALADGLDKSVKTSCCLHRIFQWSVVRTSDSAMHWIAISSTLANKITVTELAIERKSTLKDQSFMWFRLSRSLEKIAPINR